MQTVYTVFRLISAYTLFCQIGNNNLRVKLQLRVSTFRATPRQTLSDTNFRSPLMTISRKSRTLVQFPIFLFSSVQVNSLSQRFADKRYSNVASLPLYVPRVTRGQNVAEGRKSAGRLVQFVQRCAWSRPANCLSNAGSSSRRNTYLN